MSSGPGTKQKTTPAVKKKKTQPKPKPKTPPPALTKTKSGPVVPKPRNPKQQVADMRKRSEAALDEVYGPGGTRTGPTHVTGGLQFDRAELHRLAKALADEADELNDRANIPRQKLAFDAALGRLTDRLAESRRVADDVARIQQKAAAQNITLHTDPVTADSWTAAQGLLPGKDRSPLEVGRLLNDVEDRLAIAGRIVAKINENSGVAPIANIPANLLGAMNITAAPSMNITNTERLGALERGITLQPNPNVLRPLLQAANSPTWVPRLMTDAAAVGANLLNVLNACNRSVVEADKLLKTVSKSGKDISFFLTGRGGRRLDNLRFAASIGAPVWDGTEIPAASMTYGSADNPQTFADIVRDAELAPPPGQNLPPLPPGVNRDRFLGIRPFGNTGAEDGMLLPYWNSTGTARVFYTEYDIRPFVFGVDRGKERVVVGTDGNRYYTDDHYKTFKRIS